MKLEVGGRSKESFVTEDAYLSQCAVTLTCTDHRI